MILVFLALTLPAMAGASGRKNGGFGSLDFRMTHFGEDEVFMMGVSGGWIRNRCFTLGTAAYVFVPEMAVVSTAGTQYVMGGYGGILLEYTLRPTKLFNYTFSWLGGAGAFLVSSQSVLSGIDLKHITFNETLNYSGPDYLSLFLVSETGFSVNINVTPFFKISLQTAYRMTLGGDVAGLKDDTLSGVSTGIQFKFGAF